MQGINKIKILKWAVFIIVIIIIVVILIIKVLPSNKKNNTAELIKVTPKDQILIDGSEDTSTGSVHIPAVGEKLVLMSYRDALQKYKDNRIELTLGTCVANPKILNISNNTEVMLDNRAPEERIVKFNNTYSIKGYGFKIMKLSSTKLPVALHMDCNGEKGVVDLTLHK